jgi:sodium-dependent dicarboxylate transporter 2/3/5
MVIGLPLSLVMLVIAWFYLTRIACRSEVEEIPGGKKLIRSELRKLGAVSREEKRTGVVFLLVALAWIFRGLVPLEIFRLVQDSTIAIIGAVLLFLIPSGRDRGALLNWKTAVKIPWDIILLFGGGFALASGFNQSGLTEWMASSLSLFENTHYLLVIAIVSLLVIFLTEVNSNTATASLTLPIMAAMASGIGLHPYGLMVPVTIATSFAFMMPVATPPNAIVFSSRYVGIPQMARIGLWMNLVGCLILVIIVSLLLPRVWNLDLGF